MPLKKNNILYNQISIGLLLVAFVVYNTVVYQKGAFIKEKKLSESAMQGQQIWQDNNCTACHQFYGLGGYLGPDLTNIVSDSLKTETYIRRMINAGINSMPKYNFNNTEINQLISFFQAVDKTGYFPNKKIKKNAIGWVEVVIKEPKDE
jgi:nitric oxide reductase subunit C